jgi:hypothetical protein
MFIRHRQGMRGSGTIAGFCALGRLKNSPQRARGYTGEVRTPAPRNDFDIGGSRPTREENARRRAGAFDALLGWTFLCREVSE